MAEPGEGFTFKRIQLYKTETLGTGSYGAVFKAKCDQLICAAKILYSVLFQIQVPDPGKEHRQPFHRFEQECRFLKCINHPNIVQYLGMHYDPETNAPVLLMELMDESLTHFLESSLGDIPYHIQVNLSQDIAQALAFLHANGIIHRDLSSNNVLLLGGSQAKITDFGMSKFTDMNKTRPATLTQCPGTPAFMSPEALNEPPVYTEKLDTFSLGVILIQILTQKFPTPTDRFRAMKFPSPLNPSHEIQALVPIPEVERRENHISLIESSHPLLPTALECIRDIDVERPSSQQLCQILNELKQTEKYEDSKAQQTPTNYQQLHEQIRMKDQQIQVYREDLNTKETENMQLRARLEEVLQENQEVVQRKDLERIHLRRTLQQDIEAKNDEVLRLNQLIKSNQGIIISLRQKLAQQDEELSEQREMLSKKDEKIDTLRQLVESKESELTVLSQQNESCDIHSVLQETIALREQELREQSEILSNKQEEIRMLRQQVEDKDNQQKTLEDSYKEIIDEFQRSNDQKDDRIAELKEIQSRKDDELSDLLSQATIEARTPLPQAYASPSSHECSGMECTAQPDSPVEIFAGSSADIGSKLYFKPRSKETVYEFNSTSGLWHELAPHPLCDYTVVSINYMLTTVGGGLDNKSSRNRYSNQLYSYRNGKWENHFPNMPTKRTYSAAVSTNSLLVVAGGINENGFLNTVELMDLRLKEWSAVSSLPFQTFQPSVAICGEYIYLHPRYSTHRQEVIKCSLEQLIYSKPKSPKWRNISALAVSCSTLTTVNRHLLALGGDTTSGDRTKQIHEYNRITDSWYKVGEMTEARYACLTALLPDNKLMIVGGDKSDQKIEIGTLH